MKRTLLYFIIFLSIIIISCKKNKDTIPQSVNINLRKKGLNEIRAAIAGTWEIKQVYYCGIVGCQLSPYPAGDFISFLPNDTIKRITTGSIVLYEKAVIERRYDYTFNDTAFYFTTNNGNTNWVFDNIKNDTLKMLGAFDYYLTK